MANNISFIASQVFICRQYLYSIQVPTVLVYPNGSITPSSWGFLSEKSTEQMSEDKECKEWFKTYLDEDRLHQTQRNPQTQGICPASMQEVERLYVFISAPNRCWINIS